jgi:uncharacterized protein
MGSVTCQKTTTVYHYGADWRLTARFVRRTIDGNFVTRSVNYRLRQNQEIIMSPFTHASKSFQYTLFVANDFFLGEEMFSWADIQGTYRSVGPFLQEYFDVYLHDAHVDELSDTVLHVGLTELLIGLRNDDTFYEKQWQELQQRLSEDMQRVDVDADILSAALSMIVHMGLPPTDAFMQQAKTYILGSMPEDGQAQQLSEEEVAQQQEDFLQHLAAADSSFDAYHGMLEPFSLTPAAVLEQIIDALWDTDNVMIVDALILFFLHPQKAVREQILLSCEFGGRHKKISGVSLNRMVRMRNFQDKPLQVKLDSLIKKVRKSQLSFGLDAKPTQAELVQVWVGTVDGVGAKTVFCQFSSGQRMQFLGCVIREGKGFMDAWDTGFISKGESQSLIQTFREGLYCLEVDSAYLQTPIRNALWHNMQSGQVISAEILQLLEYIDPQAQWTPQPYDQTERFVDAEERIMPWQGKEVDKSLKRSGTWLSGKLSGWAMGWFEMSGQFDQRLEECINDTSSDFFAGAESITDIVMGPYREKWQQRFLELALWASYNQRKRGPQAADFLLLATQLNEGGPLETIPLMERIFKDSVSVYFERHDEEDMFGDEDWADDEEDEPLPISERATKETPADLESRAYLQLFLERDDAPKGAMNYMQLQGFLFTLVRLPGLVMPSQWLPEVVGQSEPHYESMEQAQTINAAVMALYNDHLDQVGDEDGFFIPCNLNLEKQWAGFRPIPAWCQGALKALGLNDGMGALEEAMKLFDVDGKKVLADIRLFAKQKDNGKVVAKASEVEDTILSYSEIITDIYLMMRFGPDENKSNLQAVETFVRTDAKVGRNDLCPCGSGKKFKKCCM